MIEKLIPIGIICGLAFLFSSCATPSMPTGGPRDEEGPEITETEPETGTTNFSDREIILHFSEFIERSSLPQALTVEPDIGIQYNIDWGRKSVKIVFNKDIPDSTTLILTVGTELSDLHSNEMGASQKIAVSTGPEIDEGKLYGRIIGANSGEGIEGERVLLYREPFEYQDKADYIASTDTSGVFQFEYLAEGTYQAIWVDDRNRNKIWEEEQERAQPFNQEFIELEQAEEDTLGVLFVAAEDTTRPVLQGVGLFSSQRLRMRFSKGIELTDSTTISITDTLENHIGKAYPLYNLPDKPYVLFAQSEDKLQEEQTYGIDLGGIVDMQANPLADAKLQFTGSSQEDTTQQRIITRNNISGYFPKDTIKVVYANPISSDDIIDSLKVVEGTELYEEWPNASIYRNILQIFPENSWKEGVSYELRIWDPIIEDHRKIDPTIWHDSEMGSLVVTAEDTTAENIQLQLINEEAGIFRDTVFTGSVEFKNLPPLSYKVKAFRDLNNDGEWNFGKIKAYEKPEPYFIQKEVPIKQDMAADLTIVFP